MLCLPTSWRVSSQLLHPHLLPCTAQATPLLPISSIFVSLPMGIARKCHPLSPKQIPTQFCCI